MTSHYRPRWLGATLMLMLMCCLTLFGCTAQTAFRDGQARLAEGKLSEAVERFDAAARLDPTSAEYRIAQIRARERLALERLTDADAARQAGSAELAHQLYRQVLQIFPSNEKALNGLRLLESERRGERMLRDAEAAAQRGDWEGARSRARLVLAEDPANRQAKAMMRRAAEAIEKTRGGAIASQAQLLSAAYRRPISIEFRDAPLRTVFEVISRTSGLNFVFDKDVRSDQKTSIFLRNANVETAVRMLLLSNQLELRVLDANSVLVYPNTPAKQKEFQELSVRTFYLANADAKSIAGTLKALLRVRDAVVDEKLNLVILRDSPEVIRIAERLVAIHDVPEAEVMLDVEILEVKRTRMLDLGVRWPDQLSLTPLTTNASGTLTLSDLRGLNAAAIGASISAGVISARKTDTDANILANPRIRARNREKAKIHIGERVPNITTTSTSSGFISDSVSYVDVGLKLDVEPTVYLDNEVAIKVALEVSNIISQVQTKSGTLAYQLGTRTASTVLRLKDGENQVLAGLINDEDRRTANKVPALGDLPIVGRLFGNQADDGAKTEIVLSITPRIVRNIQRPSADLQEFESGTEANAGVRIGSEPGATTMTPPAAMIGDVPSASTASANESPAPRSASAASVAVTSTPNSVTARWQSPPSVHRGDSITVGLLMQSDQPVSSVPATLSFDPRVFQIADVSDGDWLRQGQATVALSTQVDGGGLLHFTLDRSGGAAGGGAKGEGLLAAIKIKVAANAPAGVGRIELVGLAALAPSGRNLPVQLPAPLSIVIAE